MVHSSTVAAGLVTVQTFAVSTMPLSGSVYKAKNNLKRAETYFLINDLISGMDVETLLAIARHFKGSW